MIRSAFGAILKPGSASSAKPFWHVATVEFFSVLTSKSRIGLLPVSWIILKYRPKFHTTRKSSSPRATLLKGQRSAYASAHDRPSPSLSSTMLPYSVRGGLHFRAYRPLLKGRPRIQILQSRWLADKNSIDEFNKHKKDFHFDLGRLQPTSSEAKYQKHLEDQKITMDQEQAKEKWEFFQRIKGVAIGSLALVAVLSGYQILMNYKSIKAYFRGLMDFNLDITKVKDMKDPTENTKTMANMMELMNAQIDDAFVSSLKDLATNPGVYLFGAINGRRVPVRAHEFDGKYLQDLVVTDKYVVGVDEKGKVFEYEDSSDGHVFRSVSVPKKVSKAVVCNNNLYLLANDARTLYTKAVNSWVPRSRFFRLFESHGVASVPLEMERGEKVTEISSGKCHLLILTSHGRLFEMNCAPSPTNKGQFGTPMLSNLLQNVQQPKPNVPFELTNMNYEVVVSNGAKSISRRQFTSVSATAFSNVAVEKNGNIWTWGDNSSCQCGKEKAANEDIQPLPRVAFNTADLANIAKTYLPKSFKRGSLMVQNVFSTSETNFVQACATDDELNDSGVDQKISGQDLLFSFGNGLQGQLGISRYLQMVASPNVIRTLVGMQEYDESVNMLRNIGFKHITCGSNHAFVTLSNKGSHKDVLVFGSNDFGQFGNGKSVKSAKPLHIPKLIEPQDLEGSSKHLLKKFHDRSKFRLELLDNDVFEQVLSAGENSSAIFYRKK